MPYKRIRGYRQEACNDPAQVQRDGPYSSFQQFLNQTEDHKGHFQ